MTPFIPLRRWTLAMLAALLLSTATGMMLTPKLFAFYLVAIPIALWLYDLATSRITAQKP